MYKAFLLILFCILNLNANLPKTYLGPYHYDLLRDFDVSDEFIQTFQVDRSRANEYHVNYYLNVLKSGSNYIPLIQKELKDAKIPEIFLFLAMSESNFSPFAHSRSKALGIWQFMESTAKIYGLKIGEYVDERRDPIKSTQSAIKFIKYLKNDLGKWYLAAMAYNCGINRLKRAIKNAGSDDIAVLLDDDKKYIPKQTREYIRKIMILAIMFNEENALLNLEEVHTFDIVSVPPMTPFSSIAKSVGFHKDKIKKINPQYNYFFTPPGKINYKIYLPKGTKDKFVANFNPQEDKYNSFESHIVKKGDSLWDIGKKYGIKYATIKDINNLKSNHLKLKQKLLIPVIKEETIIYVVKKGDTLNGISRKLGVELSVILDRNDIGKYIKPGDKLVIPQK